MDYTQEALIAIATDTSIPLTERANKLLDIGMEAFEMDLGIISEVKGKIYTILYSNNADLVGETFELGVTYCSITLSMVVRKVFAVEHFSTSEHKRHPAFDAFQLETYIGSPIMLYMLPFGTINFAKAEPRDKPFGPSEKLLIQNLSEATTAIIKQRD